MRKYNDQEYKSVGICFRFGENSENFINNVIPLIKYFESNGIAVTTPQAKNVINQNESFLLLEGEQGMDPAVVEYAHVVNCIDADLVFMYNKDGRMGNSMRFELEQMDNAGQEIFYAEPMPNLRVNGRILTPQELVKEIQFHNKEIVPMLKARNFFDNDHPPQKQADIKGFGLMSDIKQFLADDLTK